MCRSAPSTRATTCPPDACEPVEGVLSLGELLDSAKPGDQATISRLLPMVYGELKALAARAHALPFYVAAPLSTVDRSCPNGRAIPIEARDGDEIRRIGGLDDYGRPAFVHIAPPDSPVCNPAFDVTPAALIDGIVTPVGVCAAHDIGRLAGSLSGDSP